MLGKKIVSFKKLAKKVKVMGGSGKSKQSQNEYLLGEYEDTASMTPTPTGFFAVYVGEERERFVVPTGYLSHPLFKMLLEKSYNEFGFEQSSGLVVPCSVSAFQEIVNAVECSNRRFEFGKLVEELI
ncbi:auxin-induced protein 15A-like [Pistacia vera]|uniref:auxin-induced protein 15A-like n=1 Tax=Pistacia vera TaxID=55513 RepID=UPI001262D586|nr:auxin-induced protein 15A-like [Pistacia vera]